MASLLSLALPDGQYPILELTPLEQKQQTQDMIIGISMEVAEQRPFLQLWEDLHWADPSTQELIGLLIEQAPTTSLLMILTNRPEFVSESVDSILRLVSNSLPACLLFRCRY